MNVVIINMTKPRKNQLCEYIQFHITHIPYHLASMFYNFHSNINIIIKDDFNFNIFNNKLRWTIVLIGLVRKKYVINLN